LALGQPLFVRIGLHLEQPLQVIDLALGRLGLLSRELLRPFVDRGPFLILECRQGAGTGRRHGFQGLLGEALLQRKFLRAARAGDARGGDEKQRIGSHA
jgi:hypothetical protein